MWNYNYTYSYPNELYHYGVLGMKWGHRKAAYSSAEGQRYASAKAAYKRDDKAFNKSYNFSSRHPITQYFGRNKKKADSLWNNTYDVGNVRAKSKQEYKQAKKEYKQSPEYKAKMKKALKASAFVAGTAAAIYGAKVLNEKMNRDMRTSYSKIAKSYFGAYKNTVKSLNGYNEHVEMLKLHGIKDMSNTGKHLNNNASKYYKVFSDASKNIKSNYSLKEKARFIKNRGRV